MDDLTPGDRQRLKRFMLAYNLSDVTQFREWGVQGTSRLLFARWLVKAKLLDEHELHDAGWLSRLLSELCSRLAASRDS